jgi:hypothetical protein
LLGALAPFGCNGSTPASSDLACSLNSDCAAGLVCALGKCRPACVTAADCGAGGSCITDGRNPVCQPAAEKNVPCNRPTDCPTPLACASDYRCRNLCLSDADCNVLGIAGRACATDAQGVDYCADANEVQNGMLVAPPPAGAPKTAVVEPEAGTAGTAIALTSGTLIETSIGGQGGTVGVGDVTLTIPVRALGTAVTVSIKVGAEAAPAGAVTHVFDIGPSGTMFQQPATVAFSYTDALLGGDAPSSYAVETLGQDGVTWTPLSQIVVDIYAHTIAGQTTHLSPYVLVKQGAASATTGSDASGGATPDASAASGDDGGGVASGDDGGGGGPADATTGRGGGD